MSDYSVAHSIVPGYMERAILAYYEEEVKSIAEEEEDGGRTALSRSGGREEIKKSEVVERLEAQKASMAALREKRKDLHEKISGVRTALPALSPDVKAISLTDPSSREVWDWSKTTPVLTLSTTKTAKTTQLPDASARDCYNNMELVDIFFRTQFSVRPVPNGLMRAYVHVPLKQAYNNAFWLGKTKSIYFGETDSRIFKNFVHDLGVTTHEFGHAVTEYSGNLAYQRQSGALNESLSDIFAIIALQQQAKVKATSPDAKWLIGEGLVVGAKSGNSLRSMSHPGTAYKNHKIIGSDPQPNHMRDYKKLPIDDDNDWGGVHLYSGIPNRAFYLAAKEVGDEIGNIWHRALKNAQPNDDFSTFAGRTLMACKNKQGVYQIVGKAWQEVGVDLSKTGFLNLDPPSSGAPTTVPDSETLPTIKRRRCEAIRDNPYYLGGTIALVSTIVIYSSQNYIKSYMG